MSLLRDPDGGISKTLVLFVIPAFAVLLFKFAIAGMEVTTSAGHMLAPGMTAGEFGAAFALIVGVWVARETKEAHYGSRVMGLKQNVEEILEDLIQWDEPFNTSATANVTCLMTVKEAIIAQKEYVAEKDPPYVYETDDKALADFMTIHWATFVEKNNG